MTMSNFEVKNSLEEDSPDFFFYTSSCEVTSNPRQQILAVSFSTRYRRSSVLNSVLAVGRSFLHLDRSRLARESEEDFLAIARILIVETSV